MRKHLSCATAVLLFSGCYVLAQTPAQSPSGHPPASDQLTPQVLGEMLRSATTFHELVRNLNLDKSFGPDQHIQRADGQLQHPLARTAETIGAGAGAGAAIGEMTHSQNGALIGALVGGMGGLIVDQIIKHREELRDRPVQDPDQSYVPEDRAHELKERGRQSN